MYWKCNFYIMIFTKIKRKTCKKLSNTQFSNRQNPQCYCIYKRVCTAPHHTTLGKIQYRTDGNYRTLPSMFPFVAGICCKDENWIIIFCAYKLIFLDLFNFLTIQWSWDVFQLVHFGRLALKKNDNTESKYHYYLSVVCLSSYQDSLLVKRRNDNHSPLPCLHVHVLEHA